MKIYIIPQPEGFTFSEKKAFKLTRLCEFFNQNGTEKASEELKEFISDNFGFELLGTGKEKISLLIDESLAEAESYTLDVTENLVEIKGADEAGVFYGVQSLKQIFYQCSEELPEIHINRDPPPPEKEMILIEFDEPEIEKPRQIWNGTRPQAVNPDPTQPINLVQQSEAQLEGTKSNEAPESVVDDFGDVEIKDPEPKKEIDRRALFRAADNKTKKDTLAPQTAREPS
ncbi:MAG: hypothetical protein IIW88_03850, partial [Clostridia bacterium]|nr:hypothetical protein [Clostridia bacterium]